MKKQTLIALDAENYTDTYAREKWFYQAQIESPAMFSRAPGVGSLYWLGVREKSGAYLDGDRTYKFAVPEPVPASCSGRLPCTTS